MPVWCLLGKRYVELHTDLVYVLGKRYTELHASEKKKEKASKQEQKKQMAKPKPQVLSLHTHTHRDIHSVYVCIVCVSVHLMDVVCLLWCYNHFVACQ